MGAFNNILVIFRVAYQWGWDRVGLGEEQPASKYNYK